MVWHVQHHTAKTRSLSWLLFKIAPFWWNIGTWIPGSSEYWTFVWVHKQCPARMESVHPKNVTYFCFKDPDDWLFALSPMGYWCWQGPLEERLFSVSGPSPLFVVLEWFQSAHGGLTYVPPSWPLHIAGCVLETAIKADNCKDTSGGACPESPATADNCPVSTWTTLPSLFQKIATDLDKNVPCKKRCL